MKSRLLFTCSAYILASAQAFAAALPPEPADPDAGDGSAWKSVPPGLHSGFGSLDIADAKSRPPAGDPAESVALRGWKGERVACKLLVWSADSTGRVEIEATDLEGPDFTIGSDRLSISTVRYVITDGFLTPEGRSCGERNTEGMATHLSPDLLSGESAYTAEPRTTRPVWIALDIPADAPAGTYTGAILRKTAGAGTRHPVSVVVQDKVLPSSAEWSFHLDLWQDPFSVANYYKVEPWSGEHLELLRPLLRMLGDAGQKCVTTTMLHKPWEFADFPSMIRWIRKVDGTWEFDYRIFDTYVTLAMDCGILKQINCHSMVTVSGNYFWFDEESGKTVSAALKTGTKIYEEIWRNFLVSFRDHLAEKGWLDRTLIALDERSRQDMLNVLRLIRDTTPEFKIALAGFHYDEVTPQIHDFSSIWRDVDQLSGDTARLRRRDGRITNFYVACAVPKPNNFTFSPPAESCYQPWFAAAADLDGFLRWAYNIWTPDPLRDSRHVKHPPGDTYFVYPGARSSVRFERLREGIQDYEKIRILRRDLAADPSPEAAAALDRLNAFLATINRQTLDTKSAAQVVNEGKDLLHRLSGPEG